MLKRHGIDPAPEHTRTTPRSTFLKADSDVLAAIDLTNIDVWTRGGLVTFNLLFVTELTTRRISFADCTPKPNDAWMQQAAAAEPELERAPNGACGASSSSASTKRFFFREDAFRRAIAKYLRHDHVERNHQGLDNWIIQPGEEVNRPTGRIKCRTRLVGLLRCYHRAAAQGRRLDLPLDYYGDEVARLACLNRRAKRKPASKSAPPISHSTENRPP